MIHAKLHLEAGETDLLLLEFNLPATLGRSKMADVTIPHSLISRKHCELTEVAGGNLQLRDLDSLNGTYIGESRIQKVVVHPGDMLTIGPYTYRVEFELDELEEEATTVLPPVEERKVKPEVVMPKKTQPVKKKSKELQKVTKAMGLPRNEEESTLSQVGIELPEGIAKQADASRTDFKFMDEDKQAELSGPIDLPDFGDTPKKDVSSESDNALDDFLKELP